MWQLRQTLPGSGSGKTQSRTSSTTERPPREAEDERTAPWQTVLFGAHIAEASQCFETALLPILAQVRGWGDNQAIDVAVSRLSSAVSRLSSALAAFRQQCCLCLLQSVQHTLRIHPHAPTLNLAKAFLLLRFPSSSPARALSHMLTSTPAHAQSCTDQKWAKNENGGSLCNAKDYRNQTATGTRPGACSYHRQVSCQPGCPPYGTTTRCMTLFSTSFSHSLILSFSGLVLPHVVSRTSPFPPAPVP